MAAAEPGEKEMESIRPGEDSGTFHAQAAVKPLGLGMTDLSHRDGAMIAAR